ncbi:MAG: DUF1573 domain-containing protein [Hyphomicrobiales bacterium]
MKHLTSIIIIAILLVLSIFGGRFIAAMRGEVYNNSEFAIVDRVHDFKKIKMDTVVYHVFEFKNVGDEELKLREVKPYCGCTITEYDKEIIAPGENSSIKVEFRPTSYGVFNKTIEIRTNSESTPVIYLSLKGTTR